MGLGTASDAADRDPGNATGLVFGKEVRQALGSFWYLLGTAEYGAMSETRKLAAILAADVVG
jgi:hypothetical protein